jgi:hypothetical protein
MTGKMKLYLGLLVLGLVVIGGGVWMLVKAPPEIDVPEGNPVLTANSDYLLGGKANSLYIYSDGSVLYVEEKNLRLSTRQAPPTRIWKTGQIQTEELNKLLEFIKESGFEKLESSYQFRGETSNGGFIHGDMKFTITVNSDNLSKTVTAFGYLPPDNGETYPDMPYPLNEMYEWLRAIALKTEEVARERIS